MIDVDRDYDPGFARAFGGLMAAVTGLWFRYRLRHAHRVPRGPVLFVGNHSGIGIADVLCLLGGWTSAFEGRRCVGMMHKMFVEAPVVGWIARRFGATYADPQAARVALARGYDVACFPGGDLDACRPFYEPRRVEFGARRGYVRLALEHGVPVVPVVTLGSHATYTLLPGGAWIARVTGMRSWARCERFPLVLGTVASALALLLALAGALPWWAALVALVASLVPNPVRVTSELLDPIDVAARTAHIADPAARVEAAHALVHGALARALETMSHEEELCPACAS